ncbi:pseudouridine synthase [Nonlabens sp.]|uniref:pseudouridine synthase n=1 Tax=Nonlabens sp. TaxID=1888209 RepID=UPI003F69982D
MSHRHFLIYKPYKMLSQFKTNDRHQKNKKFLGDLHDFPDGSMAVGRLDETSEGLLLITTDGQLSSHINKKGKVEKEYYAQVDGMITEEAVQKMTSGIEISINGKLYQTKECKARIIEGIPDLPATQQRIRDERHGPTSWVSVTLKEGKFRQVRKMCAAVGFPVLRLARVRIGNFTLENLNAKTANEITTLMEEK